jgi:hypothetical protein
MSTTGWMLYASGDAWIQDLISVRWTLSELAEVHEGWQGALFLRCQEQPWGVERRLLTVSRQDAIPMLACYVETSDFGYALALTQGEFVARYVVNARNAKDFKGGVWALERCVALHGRRWRQAGLRALAGWSAVTPRPLTPARLETLLAGDHLLPEIPLFNELGVALGIEAPRQ